MEHIYKTWAVAIDITSACPRSCIYCTRYTRHLRKDQRVHMTLEQFERALLSLKDWPTEIIIIGGEPLVHPQFVEFNALIRKIVPQCKINLFTSGLPGMSLEPLDQEPDPASCYTWKPSFTWSEWPEKNSDLTKTYRTIRFNPHSEEQEADCKHHPLTIAVKDAIPDKALMWKLINNCWVQRLWCPTVNYNGAYFCEVGAALDHLLFDGQNAWEVTDDWWKTPPQKFQEQVDKLCPNCGMCIPMEKQPIGDRIEKFSPSLYQLCSEKKVNRLTPKSITITDKTFTTEEIVNYSKRWMPANYRDDLFSDDELPEEWKGLRVPLKLEENDTVFKLDTEEDFHAALAQVCKIPFAVDDCNTICKFYMEWQGIVFDPRHDHYPFVLKENEQGHLLYYRSIMLYFRYIMDDADFFPFLNKGYTWHSLLEMPHLFEEMLRQRRVTMYHDKNREFEGKEVYFWGAGAAYKEYGTIFKRVRPTSILIDLETTSAPDSIDGIPVEHPRDILGKKQKLPVIVFSRTAHVEAIKQKITGDYKSLFSEYFFCLL